LNLINLDTTTQLNQLKKIPTLLRVQRSPKQQWWQSIHPNNRNTMAKHPPVQHNMVAKHPPDQHNHGGEPQRAPTTTRMTAKHPLAKREAAKHPLDDD
jgi:hypothetical protein